ncbi:helix-turn-helix domain-containing protein [Sphingobium sp.]|uniref:helix-turn-helix domain-containing protein n=1 Tax=Sphingobium sp. TaxID=1912891 RepID=UPI00257FA390|nr:helix-turn-helix transcriptional regulator [Sphingobium sp.]
MPELIEIFAKNLRDQRLRMNLTQESLADACDLHRTYIGAIERGERNISLRNLQKIADVLQIKAADLITESQK